MKHLFKTFSLVFLLSIFAVPSQAQQTPPRGLEIKIESSLPTAILSISMHNNSTGVTKVFYESNSWGAAHWRILIIRDGKLSSYFQNPNQEFTKNSPGYFELKPNDNRRQTLNINDGSWCGLNHEKVGFEKGDIIIILYDVPPTKEGFRLNVWYGVTSTITTIK